MTRYSIIQTIYTFPGFNARPRVFTITVFALLQCNIDVTSLKVSSQMTRYSTIQTIYTFPGCNTRPHIFTITVFVPLLCNIDVRTITVQHSVTSLKVRSQMTRYSMIQTILFQGLM